MLVVLLLLALYAAAAVATSISGTHRFNTGMEREKVEYIVLGSVT